MMANAGQHKISLGKAKQMTKLYREQRERILKPEFAGRDILAISDTMAREALDRLLAQPGCVAIRIYYGMDEQMQVKPIIVGVDAQGQDMLKITSADATSTLLSDAPSPGDPAGEKEGEILDETSRCPPTCVTSDLNP